MYPPQEQAAPMTPKPQLSADGVRDWWARIELDRKRRKTESEKWKSPVRGLLAAAG
jgi:hypothetical protein